MQLKSTLNQGRSSLQRPYEWHPTLRAVLKFLGSKPEVEETETAPVEAEALGGPAVGGLELGAPGISGTPGGTE